MDARIIALTCALTAFACDGPSTAPVQGASLGTPAPATNQRGTATTNQAVEGTATDQDRATGASPYLAATPPNPEVSPNSGIANGTKNAENTKINTRDRQDTLTPMNQGNSAAETTVTANIRQGIVADETVSFTGRNVKIVTVGTKVTLRGPVKNPMERATIEGIAKRTAGVSEVDNQLEVSN